MGLEGMKRAFHRFRTSEDKTVAMARDVLVSAAVLFVVGTVLWTYTDQWSPLTAPVVVVESESMMHGPFGPCAPDGIECGHAFSSPGFGRVGTIDPGDLVLVKKVRSLDDVETAFGMGGRSGYGGHGDVVVYKNGNGPPVIHRAMIHIVAQPEDCRPGGATPCQIRVPEACDRRTDAFVRDGDWASYCEFTSQPLKFKIERNGLWLRFENYPCMTSSACPPLHSGVITKGDHNPESDQASGLAFGGPVRLSQIVGKARGEIPWVGLLKLALRGNPIYHPQNDPTRADQWTILAGTAPWDEWTALALAIGALVGLPFVAEKVRDRLRRREDEPPAGGTTKGPPPRQG